MREPVSSSNVAEVLSYLGAAYPSLDVTRELLDVWTRHLRIYPLEFVQEAASKYIADGNEYPPNLGSLIAAVKRVVFLRVPPEPVGQSRLLGGGPRKIAPPEKP